MAQFAVNIGTKLRALPGDYANIEEVRKLRLLKDHPDWEVIPVAELAPATKPKRKKYVATEATLRRRELKHLTAMVAALKPIRTILYDATLRSRRSEYEVADHWVNISLSYDNTVRAITKINLRIKQLTTSTGGHKI